MDSPRHSSSDFDSSVPPLPYCAIIVPQMVYSSRVADAYTQKPTIRFSEHGLLGVRLDDALNGYIPDLVDAQTTPLVSVTTYRIVLRINWPGYSEWNEPIVIQQGGYHSQTPITLSSLARSVAKVVNRYLRALTKEASTEAKTKWHVTRFNLADLRLVELRHVSQGSWQPVLASVAARR